MHLDGLTRDAGAEARDPDRRARSSTSSTRTDASSASATSDMLLSGKRIIVTGGASGIAAAAVRAYAREGATVVVARHRRRQGPPGRRRCGPRRRRIATATSPSATRCTRSSTKRPRRWAASTCSRTSPRVERGTPAEDIPDAEWDLVFNVNVKGTVYTNQAAFRHLKDGGGAIINFGSGAGIRGQRGSAHYSASKAAVMALDPHRRAGVGAATASA